MLDITTDGLRIQIVDEKNRPMFSIGKAELQSYTKDILHEIGKMLNEVPNRVSLSGHTDATPYPSGEKATAIGSYLQTEPMHPVVSLLQVVWIRIKFSEL